MRDLRTSAWKEAEEKWNAVSSRIVLSELSSSVAQKRVSGSMESKNTYVTVISAYTPTARAPPAIAQEVINDLQDVVNQVPHSDVLLLLGDVNARCVVGDLERTCSGVAWSPLQCP